MFFKNCHIFLFKKMNNNNNSIDVVINENTVDNPQCPHGPTLLFCKRNDKNSKEMYYACSAYRDRKFCPFFILEKDKNKMTKAKIEAWNQEKLKLVKKYNHRKLFVDLNKVQNMAENVRKYCRSCEMFITYKNHIEKHKEHVIIDNISDYLLRRPTEMLLPLDVSKKEAQYLFSENSVKTFVKIMEDLHFTHIICVGTPRIHEHILNNFDIKMQSILLDMDGRFHNFFGPLQFCWYNMFNNHFFFEEAKHVFRDFIKSSANPSKIAVITDPPFGGRLEPLANTFNILNNDFKTIHKVSYDLPTFFIFPYFMECHITNYLSNFKMLDYKVEYENHNVFKNTNKKNRNNGSVVRVFTNVDLSLIKLPEADYKFCKKCAKYVSKQNKHCKMCDNCTSKDGGNYVHCNKCERCVKNSWQHCSDCNRCAAVKHSCQTLEFVKQCFNCNKEGHKKSECPELFTNNMSKKRKHDIVIKKMKRKKL